MAIDASLSAQPDSSNYDWLLLSKNNRFFFFIPNSSILISMILFLNFKTRRYFWALDIRDHLSALIGIWHLARSREFIRLILRDKRWRCGIVEMFFERLLNWYVKKLSSNNADSLIHFLSAKSKGTRYDQKISRTWESITLAFWPKRIPRTIPMACDNWTLF